MAEKTTALLQQALALSDRERAELASLLMDSLDTTMDQDAESAWDGEIARRIAELDAGTAQTIPWEQVRRKVSAKIRTHAVTTSRGV
jgi:putative addiction module component (TIGR02574 family)